MSYAELLSLASKYFIGVVATYWLAVFAYRLLLHPLRDYPGPFIARLTEGYAGFYAGTRRLHLVTQQGHRKYGPVLRIAPNRLVFNSAKALHDIYDNDRLVKSARVYLVTLGFTGTINVFSVIDKAVHRSKRKMIGAGVSERAMREFEPTMADQIDIFLKQILESSEKSNVVNMSERISRLTMDVIGLLAFGYPMNTQTEERYRTLHTGIGASNAHNNILMHWPRLQSKVIAYPLHYLTWFAQKQAFELIENMIKTRTAQGANAKRDLYAQVADQLEANPEFRLSDIWSEGLFLIPAGGDTTAAAISALLFYLSRNPECYRKLADEIRTTFTNSSEIRGGPQLSGCQYLRACIDEALRISSPVNGTLWRELAADDDGSKPLIIDGHIIPQGVQVGVNIYTLHHNPEYFSDPYAFKPERWIEGDESEQRRMRQAFTPFQIGYRGCAGKAMAYLEASLVVAKLLWYFDFEAAPGEAGQLGGGKVGDTTGRHRPGEYQMYDIFASSHDGPNLMFHSRDGKCEELAAK
ncbi:Uu.00g055450.m01.CDS01 [Anthostomella pinea]|uniref:Uu.00g055450.m01.CDS01 n=1 Tax=Anthostomella pinea TaxID=933095 RepID=A0AAI8YPS1_9PEZI|nr:Uu.00g055450.m01.CDS01 [Anthostomella pinea]